MPWNADETTRTGETNGVSPQNESIRWAAESTMHRIGLAKGQNNMMRSAAVTHARTSVMVHATAVAVAVNLMSTKATAVVW